MEIWKEPRCRWKQSISTMLAATILFSGASFSQAFVSRQQLLSHQSSSSLYSTVLPKSGTTSTRKDDSVPEAPSLSMSPEERAEKAKKTWSTTALQPTPNYQEVISMKEASIVYDQEAFEEFASLKGTYYINGLANCEIGSRLIHPFEAHGYCKSLVFDGEGLLKYTSRIVETPLTQKELKEEKVLNRGVMSTVADIGTVWGTVQNALASSERDTANLVANLWPPPGSDSGIDPILIVCTDNGEPYALDPKTLETKGLLSEYLPKLSEVLPKGVKCLAHTRYDETKNTLVMCLNEMVVPGEQFMGNSTFTFLEFDDRFDVVSKSSFTTRLMVCHDWVLTQNYYVMPKNPAYLKWDGILKFSMGSSVGTGVFAMEEETSGAFILVPRNNQQGVKEVKSDAFFNCFHFGPAFERSEDELVINGCVFDSYTFGGEMGFVNDGPTQRFDPIGWGSPPPRLDRFVIDLNTFEIKTKNRVPVIPVDMPTFNGDARELRYSYFLGASRPEGWFPFRQVVKLDLETDESIVWDAGDGHVVSEPMFVPRSSGKEDDGFVISIVHDSEEKTARLVVWNAQAFGDGPIAECPLGKLIPWCVHGSFYPGYNP